MGQPNPWTTLAYVKLALVTFKFHQIVLSWYSGQVIIVCTALWKIYLGSNPPNFFKIGRVESYGETNFGVFFMHHCV